MGEVYRARGTKLGRDVAIKVLPELFVDDAERLARFTREAQVLASLNHPHIAAIYGLDEANGARFLVLELVEGGTLADRIDGLKADGKGRGLPIAEALAIARQICLAFEAAHEKGIVHRDLKPANVALTADGQVKVLDFGLAKAVDTAPGLSSAAALTASPTITTPAMMTGVGMILGTAAYMSPEQAKGRPADKRSDVWAFGCVCYEMLTGTRLFDGEDVGDTLAAVLMREPDWSALPADTPAAIRLLLPQCLARDRTQRISDFSTVRFVLDAPATLAAAAPPVTPAIATPLWRRLALVGVPALSIGAAVAVAGTWLAGRPSATQPLTIQGFQRDIAITPDGRNIVYRVGPAGTVGAQLVVRSLDQLDARLLTGITGIRAPFISPDGHWVGFFEGNGGELKKVSILGGSPITLCKYSGNPAEASWGTDDTTIFATGDQTTGLFSVAAGGGDPKMLTTPDTAHGEADHVQPFILPGGRAVLFTVQVQGQSVDNAQIAVLDLKTGQKKTLIRGGSDARYVDTGHLVYAAAGTLRAVRFDLGRLEVTSDPVPVVEKVTMSGTTGTANYVLSQNGTLVYVPGGVGAGLARSLAWVNRQGREDLIKAPLRTYSLPRISPDGTRVALDIRDQENDIWVWDLTRETLARFTFDPGADQFPVWTPDSRRIIFSSARGGVQNLYWQAADNTGTVERLTTSPNTQGSTSISPDGSRVLFTEAGPKTNADIGMLTLTTPSATVPRPAQALIQTAFNETNAELSPDGQWMAYESNESGTNQVYVRPFPEVDAGRWQISTGAGSRPLWAHSGRELFYVASGALWAVAVQTTGSTFSAGNPAKLFDTGSYSFSINARTLDVSADGQQFLMIKTAASNATATLPSLVVVEHWTEELKARVGGK